MTHTAYTQDALRTAPYLYMYATTIHNIHNNIIDLCERFNFYSFKTIPVISYALAQSLKVY